MLSMTIAHLEFGLHSIWSMFHSDINSHGRAHASGIPDHVPECLATWNYELALKRSWRGYHMNERGYTNLWFSQNFTKIYEFYWILLPKNIENNGIPCSVLSTSSLNCSSSSKWDFAGFADRAPCEVNKLPITTNNNRLPLFEILWFLFLPKGGTTIQHPQHAWTPWQFFTYFIDSCRYSCKVLFVWWPVDHDVHTLTTWICPWPSWTRPLVVNYQIEESKVAVRKTFTCYKLHI